MPTAAPCPPIKSRITRTYLTCGLLLQVLPLCLGTDYWQEASGPWLPRSLELSQLRLQADCILELHSAASGLAQENVSSPFLSAVEVVFPPKAKEAAQGVLSPGIISEKNRTVPHTLGPRGVSLVLLPGAARNLRFDRLVHGSAQGKVVAGLCSWAGSCAAESRVRCRGPRSAWTVTAVSH